MTATPTPGGISLRSISLPVICSREAASISRWWRLVGRRLDDSCARHALCLERLRHPARKRIWMEARADVFGFHARGGHVRGLFASGRKTSRQVRAFLDCADGKYFGQPEFFALRVYVQPLLSLFFLRHIGRTRPWIRFRNCCSGDGQVVSRPNGPGHRTCAARIWRRIGHFRHVRKSGAVSALRLADFLHDPRRNFSCDDHDRGVFAEESGDQRACNGESFRSQHRQLHATNTLPAKSCAPRLFICCGSASDLDRPRGSWSSAS